MTSFVRGARWIVAVLLYAVGAPIALFLLALYLGAAVVIGLLLSLVFVMVLAGFVGSVSNPVQWLVAIPTVAACLIVGGWMWSEKLGVRSLSAGAPATPTALHGWRRSARSRPWQASETPGS